MSLCTVLDQKQTVLFTNLFYVMGMCRLTKQVDKDDAFCFGVDLCFQQFGIDAVRFWQDVSKHRFSGREGYGFSGRNPAKGLCDDVIARRNAQRFQSNENCIGAIPYPYTMACSWQRSKGRLKLPDKRASNKLAAFKHRLHRLIDFRFDASVLSF